MAETLPPITRPNGKPYQPTKIIAHAWEDHDECKRGVVILGSNDPARVREFATEMCRYWFLGEYAVGGRPGWYRQGYWSGELRWLDDESCRRLSEETRHDRTAMGQSGAASHRD